MKSIKCLASAITIASSLLASTQAQTTSDITYDLSRDFSVSANPNGVWSYGWKSNIVGNFTRLLVPRTYFVDGAHIEDWVLAANQIPQVFHNASTNITATSDGGLGSYPPGVVTIVPGFDGTAQNFCAVRFTVPAEGAGTYHLKSAVQNRLNGASSTDADYHVVVNGVEVFSQFLSPNSTSRYTNNLSLVAGDTVDFLCGRGADGRTYGAGLKIQAMLATPNICTPHKATATAQVVNGFVVGATITDDGCGYTNAPLVLIQDGGGSGATATAVISNGKVTGITITSTGCCYTNLPKIVIASPPFVPTVSIQVSRVKVLQNVVLGRKYVLESSIDFLTWNPAAPAFVAQSESVETEVEVDATVRYFRVQEVP